MAKHWGISYYFVFGLEINNDRRFNANKNPPKHLWRVFGWNIIKWV